MANRTRHTEADYFEAVPYIRLDEHVSQMMISDEARHHNNKYVIHYITVSVAFETG